MLCLSPDQFKNKYNPGITKRTGNCHLGGVVSEWHCTRPSERSTRHKTTTCNRIVKEDLIGRE